MLRDVSFTVEPGERIGIAGHTGAGKTTLINLLLRFYDVNRGRIAIDGVDIREIPLDALRRRFGLVLQDVFLFSGTIRDNIAFGPGAGSDAAVRAAADAAHASPFIDRLPGGLDAEVAERGATLSAGQKQLLSFARALAFDPQVLVLDEATSNVDTATETLIRDALHRLIAGRTTLAIAHRLSTVRDMDRILVFHKGELRESGPHRELLAQRGLYHTLYQLQYRDQEAAAPSGRGRAGASSVLRRRRAEVLVAARQRGVRAVAPQHDAGLAGDDADAGERHAPGHAPQGGQPPPGAGRRREQQLVVLAREAGFERVAPVRLEPAPRARLQGHRRRVHGRPDAACFRRAGRPRPPGRRSGRRTRAPCACGPAGAPAARAAPGAGSAPGTPRARLPARPRPRRRPRPAARPTRRPRRRWRRSGTARRPGAPPSAGARGGA